MMLQSHSWENSKEKHDPKGYTHPYVQSSTAHNGQDMETTWTPINWWTGKDVVSTHSGTLLSFLCKKELNDAMCGSMDATSCCDTKRGKSERERQTPSDIIHTWDLKYGTKWTYEQNKNRLTERRDLWLLQGREGKGRAGDLGLTEANYHAWSR